MKGEQGTIGQKGATGEPGFPVSFDIFFFLIRSTNVYFCF